MGLSSERGWRRGGPVVVGLVAVLILVLAACGSADPDEVTTPGQAGEPGGSPDTATPGPQLYELTATVLDAGEGPELCAGGIAQSYPPQCSGPPVEGWDWSAVDHESGGDVRWGSYHLVGTWDGTTFTMTEPAGAPQRQEGPGQELDFTPPCPEPVGGWPTAEVTFEQWEAFMSAAQDHPEHAGSWVWSRSQPADPGQDVYTIAYTGDADAHRARLEAIWPGPICVIQRSHTSAELSTILSDVAAELQPQVLWGSVNELDGTVEVGVLVASPEVQADLDDRYGPGLVQLAGVMRPVDR